MSAILLALCLCGAGPEAQPVGLVQLTYKFGTFHWPGYSLDQWKSGAKAAGDYWASQAAVRFREVPDAKPRMYTFDVTTRNLPGKAGLWQPGHLIVSTYPPVVAKWNKLTPALQDHYARSLIWEEEFHALRGPQSVHLRGPQAMIAWVRARYGPPLKKGLEAGPLPEWLQDEEVQRLLREPPPLPRLRDRAPLRRLIHWRNSI